MTVTLNGAPTRQGRAARTALLGFLAAGLGSHLFEDASDPWATAPSFVLVTFGTAALAHELTTQAQREGSEGVNRWSHTDTANVAILLGYAALLSVAAGFQRLPWYEETSAVSFAVLFTIFAGYFAWVRRKTLGPTTVR
jgi:cobalamin synthase